MADKEFILPIQGHHTAAEIAAINDQIARGVVEYPSSQEIVLQADGQSTRGTPYRLVGSGINAQFKPLTVDGVGNNGGVTTNAEIAAWAGNLDSLIAGSITRDANGAATNAAVVWPDGATGAYAATTVSTAFPGAVDAYTVTHVLSGLTKTATQSAVTRDANGAVTARPAIGVV